jgi:hypothetical protein
MQCGNGNELRPESQTLGAIYAKKHPIDRYSNVSVAKKLRTGQLRPTMGPLKSNTIKKRREK